MSRKIIQCPGCNSKLRFEIRADRTELECPRCSELIQLAEVPEEVEILEDEPGAFDLVISDVVMPGMDGPTLIREAQQYLGDARVIFVSGYADPNIAKQLDDREITFLAKPFNVRQLAEKVKQQLGVRKEREAA